MKNISTIFVTVCFFIALPSIAQGIVPLTYTPTYENSNRVEENNSTVDAYYISDDGFVKIKIKVLESRSGMRVLKCLVRSGYGLEWISCSSSQVQTVRQFSDGKIIAANFYYKTYIFELGRWVYF